MRALFVAILVLHGLIHLLGFVKAFELAPISALTAQIPRPVGALWLAACLALLVSAGLVVAAWPQWWIMGALAVVVSQALVITAWTDARVGTLPNLLLLVAVVGGFGLARFSAESDRQVRALLEAAPSGPGQAIGADELAALPPAVVRWLERSGATQRPRPRVVRLVQRAEIQLAPGGGFRPARAHQYFRTDDPAFLWRVRLSMFGVPVVGRDSYLEGRGRMRIEAAGLLPMVDEADAKIDQGALLRYLGETVWFPAAAVGGPVRWEAGDDPKHEARATMRHGGVEASADFRFDDQGRFLSMHARRYRGGGDGAELASWSVRAEQWARFEGIELPARGEVIWHLDEGDFVFYRWTLESLELDVREPYPNAP